MYDYFSGDNPDKIEFKLIILQKGTLIKLLFKNSDYLFSFYLAIAYRFIGKLFIDYFIKINIRLRMVLGIKFDIELKNLAVNKFINYPFVKGGVI